ncbi:MAG: dihydrolipoamide acetyltransferase family protein [Verrucomicrobia bacterium]|nr:dihydrolipoamide acetyltransferase family protein [Verrucomicrobiota bacterium]
MKIVEVHMPQMGQSAAEGTIVKWHKQVGDTVKVDEVVVEVESDKVNFEVESPCAGRLTHCLAAGTTVPVGEAIATIETSATEQLSPAPLTPPQSATAGAVPNPDRAHMGQPQDQELVSTAAMPAGLEGNASDAMHDWLSPGVMRLALLNKVTIEELGEIKGSGRSGRVTRDDVLKYIGRRSDAAPSPGRAQSRVSDTDTVVPMTTMRKTIADHMTQSIRTSAHVTMVHAVDMTHMVALRERIKDAFLKRHGVRMSYTTVFTYVTSRVLPEFPAINASVVGTNIVLRRDVHIGCAVALPDESLVVPVVKDANRKSFTEISLDLARLIDLARQKALSPSDVNGGTFTISNFGAFGSVIGTPLINQPQVAILGMGAIYKAPVVVEDKICVRDMTYLSFSFDHRVIDGAMGGRFLKRLQESVEALKEEDLDVAQLT